MLITEFNRGSSKSLASAAMLVVVGLVLVACAVAPSGFSPPIASAKNQEGQLRQAKRLLAQSTMTPAIEGLGRVSGAALDQKISKAEKAADLYRGLGDQRGLSRASLNKAKLYQAKKSKHDVDAALDEALRAAENANCDECLAAVKSYLGGVHVVRGERSNARQNYSQAALLYRQAGEFKKSGAVFYRIGVLESSWGHYGPAKRGFDSAYKAYEEDHYASGQIMSLIGLGTATRAAGYRADAVIAFEKALKSARTTKGEADDLRVLAHLAQTKHEAGLLDGMERLFDEMDEKIDDQKPNALVGRMYYDRAIALKVTGRLERAREAFKATRDRYQREKAVLGAAAAEMQLSSIETGAKNLELADTHIRAARELLGKATKVSLASLVPGLVPFKKDRLTAAIGVQEMLVLVGLGKHQTAYRRITAVENEMRRTGKQTLIAIVLVAKTTVQFVSRDLDAADQTLDEAREIYERLANAKGLKRVKHFRARVARARATAG